MKRAIIIFLAVTTALSVTNCTEDDDATGAAFGIQGTYTLIAETEGGIDSILQSCDLQQTISFSSTTGILRTNDNDTPPCSFDNIPFTYIVNRANLELTIVGSTNVIVQAVVEEGTSTSLRLRFVSDSISGPYGPDGEIVQSYSRQ